MIFVTDISIPNNHTMPIINLNILEKSLVAHIVENILSRGQLYKGTSTVFTTTRSSSTHVPSVAENTPERVVCTVILSLLMKTRNIPAHCVIIKPHRKVLLHYINSQYMKGLHIHAHNVNMKQQHRAVSLNTFSQYMKVRNISVRLVTRNILKISHYGDTRNQLMKV